MRKSNQDAPLEVVNVRSTQVTRIAVVVVVVVVEIW